MGRWFGGGGVLLCLWCCVRRMGLGIEAGKLRGRERLCDDVAEMH